MHVCVRVLMGVMDGGSDGRVTVFVVVVVCVRGLAVKSDRGVTQKYVELLSNIYQLVAGRPRRFQ